MVGLQHHILTTLREHNRTNSIGLRACDIADQLAETLSPCPTTDEVLTSLWELEIQDPPLVRAEQVSYVIDGYYKLCQNWTVHPRSM